MLTLIWIASIALSGVSLVIMAGLILHRLVEQRRSAAAALARQRLLRALIAFSGDHDRAALETAVRRTPPRITFDAGFEFLGLLRGESHDRIARVLVELGMPALVGAELERGDEARRIQAAEVLAHLPAQYGTDGLLRALRRDRSPEVRIAAAISLGDLGAVPPLGETLEALGSRGQRSRRLIELFRRWPAERLDELEVCARETGGPEFLRAAAIGALSQKRDLRFAPLFRRAANDPSAEVAAAAIQALGRTGQPDAAAVIGGALGRDEWQLRAAASEAAGRLALTTLIPPLLVLLDDPSWAVRYAAGTALRALGPAGEDRLAEVARRGNPRSRRTADLVLSEGALA